ncbi:MAG: tRNA pseudouridine(55) synthase TruB [Candidatus Magasanikbacteria bacterium CG10_big_fil_rev_8_21_14_0_10_40_10]|uniref:tRNA pseudouridine synthase B n=1 Tax=Candidatus Magasanikbacteria bacterium CG10_big_fil_rev_8_21_14_0_10_40_10 TaxID=1974648 RepID=A0A2M6W416_9BACT|nr:MAG: tRNA pseudouridine(55) synthase TruB [Candidatus Magasanikbacteria bacterium CG10_big_fil_rev_8_21_14_0_10_40_10]
MIDMETEDIILIDKPKGITSFDVIRRLRRQLGIKKMGHAGTLDPLATGLMIVGVGSGTKKLNEFLKLDKTYEAEILLGKSTDTGDLEGEVLEEKSVSLIDDEKIKKVLAGLVGDNLLPVPVYSAIKRGGEALYKKARRGEDVEPPKKNMTVYRAELKRSEFTDGAGVLKVVFDVASGTYIRSLAEEIGQRLGYPATIKELRRTQVGQWRVEEAKKLSV